jgi:hypothetical protein
LLTAAATLLTAAATLTAFITFVCHDFLLC